MDFQKYSRFILVLLGISIMVFFLWTFNFTLLKEELQFLDSLWLFLPFIILLTIFNILFKAWRWNLLIEKISGIRAKLWFAFKSIIAGVAASSIIPGRVEVAKSFLYKSKYHVHLSQSFSALVMERIMDLLSLLLILLLSIVFVKTSTLIMWVALLLFGLIFVIFLGFIFFPVKLIIYFEKIVYFIPFFSRFKKIAFGFLEKMLLSFSIFKQKKLLAQVALFSLVANGLEVLRLYIVFSLFGVETSIIVVGFVFTVSILAGILSAIPGGIGVTEFSSASIIVVLLPSVMISTAKSIVLVDRFISYYLLIIIGAVLLIQFGFFSQKNS